MAKTANTELTTRDENQKLILGESLPDIEDSEGAIRAIVGRILHADSLAAIFASDTSIATKDLVGIPLQIMDCALRRSEIEGARGTYMLIEAIRGDTGDVILVNTGSPKIMAQIYRCKERKLLPVQVMVVEVGAAKPGQHAPLGLQAIGATADAAAAA